MKYILFLFLTFGFFGCNTSSQETPSTTVNTTPAPQAKTVFTKTKRDSIIPQKKMNRSNYIVDTARPKTEVKSTYPYDIDLKLADGSSIKSDKVLNSDKPTILLFWLTTCYPCRLELKAIKEKYAKWQEEADFNLYAISTDFSKNYPNFVKRLEEEKWPWEAYNDVNREFRHVMPGSLNGLPQTFVLDKNGEIVYHKRKYRSGDEDILFDKVKALAAK